MNFSTQEMQFRKLKFYRFLLTTQDIARASVPFPDNQYIEYPDADWFRYISEKRIKRWGRAVDLFDRDPKTSQILEKLDEPISMSFANETPLDDVLKYIKQATTTPTFSGIPIYVDPLGLQEAERSLNSTVTDRPGRCPAEDHLETDAQATRPGVHREGRVPDDHIGGLGRQADRDPRLPGG